MLPVMLGCLLLVGQAVAPACAVPNSTTAVPETAGVSRSLAAVMDTTSPGVNTGSVEGMKPILQASRIRNNSDDYEITAAAAALEGYDPVTLEPLQKSREGLQDRQQQPSETQSGGSRHSSSTAAVIGGVLGGACGAVALAAGWILFNSRRQAKRSTLVTATITTPTAPSKPGPGAAQFGVTANTSYDYTRYMSPKQQNPTPWSRPHAVQVPAPAVPKTAAPSSAGNRPQQAAVHQPMQYMHSPPQAASLGYQQTQGGFQQPVTAALTFDQVWANLNKLSPIREH